ncbi:PAS domain-containing protein [Lysobacter sp. A6]|uniref:histidine kinase n=1 Tax=Noviluteimonas lactosilytica TaxID=2888523 RepID=A0ABS8JM21_9GAMM|nr:alternative oxidase [Lysobacter lactosilyticus]MCC8364646.1 PAS domain-containing protein [Lysobacter lactosilyticus]
MHVRAKQVPVESHHPVRTPCDRVARGIARTIRLLAEACYGKRYCSRVLVVGMVAAVPGMVAGAMLHLRCLRRMSDDNGSIRRLLDEADNKRMHLMIFMRIAQPTRFERTTALVAQAVFFHGYLMLHLASSRMAHRVVGYLREEAIEIYTRYLDEIEAGRIDNAPAPPIAIDYWMLPHDARLRDVVMQLRVDEAAHRDVNHAFASHRDATVHGCEARFRSIANAVPQIMWITDGEGRVEFVNRQWSRYTGIAFVQGAADDSAVAALHPDDVEHTMARFHHARELGEPFTVEHRIRAASGAYRWFLARAEPEMEPATGRPRRFYGTCVDIHERRIAEAKVGEADRRKEEFIATLAHELRNPLAPIRTGLAVLDMNPPLETAAKTRAVMARQLCHMVRLIDDLLDVSRINNNKIELQLETVDLRGVLKDAIEATHASVEAGRHELIVSLPSAAIYVDADRTRLAQVFGNLLGNAAKYTPPEGRIDLSADVIDGRALIQVRDTGVGIDAAALDSVFELFSQIPTSTALSQGGLGIGLSLVKRLVQMHGGSVWAVSAGAGEGSTFFVTLPCAAR